MRWQADEELTNLIRRYYQGEAGLWGAIQALINAEVRRRGGHGAYHIRLRRHSDGYEIIVNDAEDYIA